MATEKKIAKLEVIDPGSYPDVDSDFHTEVVDLTVKHVEEELGKDNVSSIITFNTLASKSAFKTMCTIYEVPFAIANKIAALVPKPIEGVVCTLDDIYNPESSRYNEAVDFRKATSGENWRKIIEGARAIEKRYKSTGVHACGVIMSSKPLKDVIPLMVRQDDGAVISQWTYPECESIGLIKFDFLSLDNIDIIQKTVEYIQRSGKEAPNMTEIIHGPMDDKKTYELFQRGDTVGVFQFGSHMVREYCKTLRPDTFEDIAATTAILRPGPMGMETHTKYANRKQGRAQIEQLHPDFVGSPLEGILSKTMALCVPKDTKIINSDNGQWVSIEDVKEGMKTISKNNNDIFEAQPINNVIATGRKNIIKLTLKGNRTLRVSETHPILTNNGYKEAKDITLSDTIATAYNELFDVKSNNDPLNENKAYYLGKLIANNININDAKSSSTQLTNEINKIWVNEFNSSHDELNALLNSISHQRNSTYISNKIMSTSNENLRHFISGILDNIGIISDKNIAIKTNKADFIETFTQILIRLGLDYSINKELYVNNYNYPIHYESINISHDDYKKLISFSRCEDNIKNYYAFNNEFEDNNSSLIWKSIIKIEDDGVEDCYDIEVDKNHNFLVNGFVVHNCVYQEQIMQISNQIAGMSLQEGDVLRKAMGKKKKDVMAKMKDRFFEGARANGYSDQALEVLWNTIAEFARYGFNRSHAVAYAMNAYQTAYLKANYPREFMAAMLSQNVEKKDKILMFLQESNRMRLKIGSVNINVSDIDVAPDFSGSSDYDIVYGISGISAVSKDMAKIIVHEREQNGPYKDIQDVIERCMPLGVNKKNIYENLAYSGAFDCFNITRKSVIDSLPKLMSESKTKSNKGASLFDMFGGDDANNSLSIKLDHIKEYPYVDKLQKEADVIGLYLTNHPLDNTGIGLGLGKVQSIEKLLSTSTTTTVNIVGSITEVERKSSKQGSTSIKLTIDDNTSYIQANLKKELVMGIDKTDAQDRIKRQFINNENDVPKEVIDIATNVDIEAINEVEKNNIYIMNVTFRPAWGEGQYGARINSIRKLELSENGLLPIRIRAKSTMDNMDKVKEKLTQLAKLVSSKYPGKYPIYAGIITENDVYEKFSDADYYEGLVDIMKNRRPPKAEKESTNTTSNKMNRRKSKSTDIKETIALPVKKDRYNTLIKLNEKEISENIAYFDTGYTTDKSTAVEEVLSSKLGAERVDYGIFNEGLLEGG